MVKNATKIRQRTSVAWLLLATAFFLLSLRAVTPYDIWYLLLAGEKFLQTGAVPQQEFFLYPGYGTPQLFGGWGYGVLAELARRAGGLIGLSLFNAALWTSCLLLAVAAMRERAGLRLNQPFTQLDFGALLLTLVAVYPLLLDRTAFRPEVMTYILWLLAYLLLERGRTRHDFAQAWLVVPALAWLAAWLHTAAALFLPLLAAFMAETVLEPERQTATMRLRAALPWLGAIAASAVLPTLNPNGVAQVYANLSNIFPSAWAGAAALQPGSTFQQTPLYNLEYLPFWQLPHLYPLYAQATGLLLILLLFARRRPHLMLSVLPFALYALLHARGLGLWGLAMLVPFGALLQELTHRFLATQPRSVAAAPRPQAPRENYALPVGLLSALFAGIIMQNGGWSWPQAQPPHAALMQSLRESLPAGGHVFTEYHLGAVTAWSLGERYRVALSAHMLRPNQAAEQHYTRLMLLQDGWQDELWQHEVKAAVLDIVALYGGQIMPLPRHLVYNAGWRLVAVSGATAAFVRTPASDMSVSDHLAALRNYWQVVARFPSASTADRALAHQRLTQLEQKQPETEIWREAVELEARQSP